MNSEEFSCIKQVVKTVQLSLPLMFISNEFAGITGVLDSWRRQYVKQLEGIVVHYKNVSLTSRYGAVSTQRSYAIYNVKATFDLFCPNIGDIVKGKINRVSREHIGCLIQETINVNIHLPRNSHFGLSKYIHLEREILFEISHFSCETKGIRVTGDITPKCIELMDELFPVVEENTSFVVNSSSALEDDNDRKVNLSIFNSAKTSEKDVEKSKKRKRESESSGSESEEESPKKVTVKVEVKTPKKKKRRSLEERTDLLEQLRNNIDENSTTSPEKTPKKKKKKKSHDGSLTMSLEKTPKKKKSHAERTDSLELFANNLDENVTTSPDKIPKKKKSHEERTDSLELFTDNPGENVTASPEKTPKKKKGKSLGEKAASPEKTPKKKKSKSQVEQNTSPEKSPKKKKSKKGKDAVENDVLNQSIKMDIKNNLDASMSDSSETDAINQALVNSEHRDLLEAIKSEIASPTKSKAPEEKNKKKRKREEEGGPLKKDKKHKKKNKDGTKSKDKKNPSKKKSKMAAAGTVVKKDKKNSKSKKLLKKVDKSKKSSKKDDKSKSSKSKKNNKKDKSDKRKSKKLKLSTDDVIKEIKEE